LAAGRRLPALDRTSCETLHWTGCRPSELLEIIPARIDLSGGTIVKRVMIEVGVPDAPHRGPKGCVMGLARIIREVLVRVA